MAAVLLGLISTVVPASAGPALLIAAIVVGLPHGGLDHVVARAAFAPRHRGRWWLAFLAGYLALAAGVLLSWHLAPATMLAAFLLLSIAHFGSEDGVQAGDARVSAILAHGGVPVVVPALVRPDAVGRLFALLAGDGGAPVLDLVVGPLAAVWLIAAGVFAYRHVRRPDRRPEALIGFGATIALFAIALPLCAFAVYFAVVHTPRAFASLRRGLPVRERHALVVRSLPLAALGVAAGVAVFALAPGTGDRDGAVRAAFVMLSALTVPHMALAWLADRARAAAALRSDRA